MWRSRCSLKIAAFGSTTRSPLFVLSPTEMTVEFEDSSVEWRCSSSDEDPAIHFTPAARRIDPIALQPQDFAEEWLTRPWSEMESRSVPRRKRCTSRWRRLCAGDYVELTQCAPEQPVWLAGFDIDCVGDKELKEPRRVYLQIRDLGDHRYRMESATSRGLHLQG